MIFKNILMVGIGGGIGSIARYLCQKFIYSSWQHAFPLATFLVNILGCFLIGVFFALAEKGELLDPSWRLFLTTGICGGFTTFSAFAYENVTLLKTGNLLFLGLYAAGSVFFGIAATFGGIALFRLI
jgi:fluoride exporter